MKKEDTIEITEEIKNILKIRNDFHDYEINLRSQLFFAQKSFFQVISGLVLVIIGISYTSFSLLEINFVIVSFIFGILALIFSISYGRESIDYRDKMLRIEKEKLIEKTDFALNNIIISIKSDSNDIFDHDEKVSDIPQIKSPLNYIGEIIVLFFFLSLGFLFFAFISKEFDFGLISIQTAVLLLFIYVISFKNWILKLSDFLSTDLKKPPLT
ncbi:MAG: protein-S-isoprenylcysteine O-methyltransferase Ste14 [Crocinitomicaceae bacterium]|jgi:protein-S-isoprenylcysteine O-methyltransferase Ste14